MTILVSSPLCGRLVGQGHRPQKSPDQDIERSLPKSSLLPVLHCPCMGRPHRRAMGSYFTVGHSGYSDKGTVRKLLRLSSLCPLPQSSGPCIGQTSSSLFKTPPRALQFKSIQLLTWCFPPHPASSSDSSGDVWVHRPRGHNTTKNSKHVHGKSKV